MTNSFITALETEGQTLLTAGETAWASAKAELSALASGALTSLGNAITTAINDAEDGATIEEIETAVLNIVEAELATLLKGFSSGALQALIVFALFSAFAQSREAGLLINATTSIS